MVSIIVACVKRPPSNVRVERSAAALTLIEATLSWTATSPYPHRSYRPCSRSNALL